MKNFLSILLLFSAIQYCAGQDKITLKNDQQLDVRIIEKTHKMLSYKMGDYTDGPLIWIKINHIRKIEYKNGVSDLMGFQNPRKDKPLTISAGGAFAPVGKSGFVSATLDYFITPQIDLEMNFGTSDITTYGMYFSAGSRIHLTFSDSENRLTPFTGLLAGYNYGDGFIQIPGGLNYITGKGINVSLSLNEMIGFSSWYVTFIELRIGWRFKI